MRLSALLALVVLLPLVLGGCGAKPAPSDRTTPPRVGACRDLDTQDVAAHTDDTPTVACSRPHTAQTFLVGRLPRRTGASYDDRWHGSHVYDTCGPAFERFLGADDSLVMRIRISWVWFRPSAAAWKRGARWFRCDAVGGPDGARRLAYLPTVTKGLFQGRPAQQWLACSRGSTFAGSTRVPCSARHDWRAIATVKLGQPDDPYPGDRISEVRARDYCSDQVGAWLNYALDYGYGYTYFHAAEWRAGNRRAVCWAETDQ
ncbi:septum formation family protein [Nocardioides terrisoli]|uniref:septum formation family protein n=1 Tax=Nocardioides terrisoli TaxID=3388267 RepID=UPI00287B7FBA|nr:septum formation family protein [Nocardioides marmorisolisilvae]